MLRALRWSAAVATFALLICVCGAVQAAEEKRKETGTISGTVMDKDGKPAAGVNVRLFHPFARGERGARSDEARAEKRALRRALRSDKPGESGKTTRPAKPAGRDRADRPSPVSSAVTDNDGKFTMKDIPVGKYVVMAMLRGQGGARQEIEVKTSEETKVDLKLAQRDRATAKGNNKSEKASETE